MNIVASTPAKGQLIMNKTKLIALKIIYCLLLISWIFNILYGTGRFTSYGDVHVLACVAAVVSLIGDWMIERYMKAKTDQKFTAFVPVGGLLFTSAIFIIAELVRPFI